VLLCHEEVCVRGKCGALATGYGGSKLRSEEVGMLVLGSEAALYPFKENRPDHPIKISPR